MAIYTIAIVSSAASVLLCQHHHHHHTEAHHTDECECNGIAFVADCCDHHHTLHGENHTDYISNEQRHDSRSTQQNVLQLMPHVTTLVVESLDHSLDSISQSYDVDEHTPLRAAHISHESLRAPPVVA